MELQKLRGNKKNTFVSRILYLFTILMIIGVVLNSIVYVLVPHLSRSAGRLIVFIVILLMIAVLISFIGLGFFCVQIYNKLIPIKNKMENDWQQVNVLLIRRDELIPKLVSIAQTMLNHERITLERIVLARNRVIRAKNKADRIEAEKNLGGIVPTLLVLVENYPQLKGNTSAILLYRELINTENEIAHKRQYYNESVTNYNNHIELLPNRIAAYLLSFERGVYF